MSVRVKVYGDRLDLADELEEEFHAVAKEAVTDGSKLLLRETQRLLRLRRGTTKTSSPDGDPPEWDTGALEGSFGLLPARVRGRTASAGVGSPDPGANRVEFGATDSRGVRTFPHPFMMRALANVQDVVTALFQARFGVENIERMSIRKPLEFVKKAVPASRNRRGAFLP